MRKRRKWVPRTPEELEAMKIEEAKQVAIARSEQIARLNKFRRSCPRLFVETNAQS